MCDGDGDGVMVAGGRGQARSESWRAGELAGPQSTGTTPRLHLPPLSSSSWPSLAREPANLRHALTASCVMAGPGPGLTAAVPCNPLVLAALPNASIGVFCFQLPAYSHAGMPVYSHPLHYIAEPPSSCTNYGKRPVSSTGPAEPLHGLCCATPSSSFPPPVSSAPPVRVIRVTAHVDALFYASSRTMPPAPLPPNHPRPKCTAPAIHATNTRLVPRQILTEKIKPPPQRHHAPLVVNRTPAAATASAAVVPTPIPPNSSAASTPSRIP